MTRKRGDRDDTRHLLRSPKNAERLLRSIAEADAGSVIIFESVTAWLDQAGREDPQVRSGDDK